MHKLEYSLKNEFNSQLKGFNNGFFKGVYQIKA